MLSRGKNQNPGTSPVLSISLKPEIEKFFLKSFGGSVVVDSLFIVAPSQAICASCFFFLQRY